MLKYKNTDNYNITSDRLGNHLYYSNYFNISNKSDIIKNIPCNSLNDSIKCMKRFSSMDFDNEKNYYLPVIVNEKNESLKINNYSIIKGVKKISLEKKENVKILTRNIKKL